MTFQEFVEIVTKHFPSAEWGFQDHGEVSPHYHPGKRYYTWQEGFSCAAYDEREQTGQEWLVGCGRGSQGRGATIEEALANEEQNYQPKPAIAPPPMRAKFKTKTPQKENDYGRTESNNPPKLAQPENHQRIARNYLP